LKPDTHESSVVSDTYLVELKDTVFQDTPLTEDEFSDDRQIEFPSEGAAEEWISEKNELHDNIGGLTLHAAHPNDKSDVEAYVVFQPQGRWVPDSDA
jgi:hypothetical protein